MGRGWREPSFHFFLLPPVNHLVAFLQPADPGHLAPRSGSIHVDDQVIFSHEHLQAANHIPAGQRTSYHKAVVYKCRASMSAQFVQEEVFHDVVVVRTAAVRQVTSREHDDGVQAFSIIA